MITLKNRPARKNTNSRKNTTKKVETMNATANENTLFSNSLNAMFEELDALDAAETIEVEKVEETPAQVEEVVIEDVETLKTKAESNVDALMAEIENLDMNELEDAVTSDASPIELEALEKAVETEEKKNEETLAEPTPVVDPLAAIMSPKPVETIAKKAKKVTESSRDTIKSVGIAGVLKNRIGADISSLYLTEGCDEETKKQENETIISMLDDRVICSQKKVAEKMLAFFPFMTGHSEECNKVLKIAFTLLHEEGALTTTKNGNLFKALRSNGYSEGTANAQSGQVFTLFQLLKIVGPNVGKGVVRRFEENPSSHVYKTTLSRLGLAESAVEGASA